MLFSLLAHALHRYYIARCLVALTVAVPASHNLPYAHLMFPPRLPSSFLLSWLSCITHSMARRGSPGGCPRSPPAFTSARLILRLSPSSLGWAFPFTYLSSILSPPCLPTSPPACSHISPPSHHPQRRAVICTVHYSTLGLRLPTNYNLSI
ncbi:uncharacterized protein SCHCODRAFT_02275301 [Schizophyllum commune H4-8]|uniref:uncharacterized protein n=1 Tax=Schizophyllum commune (strain H4-8 / FGSC 9210) TaxID=578458 RepID=UPI00216038BE|nr:uncharacterized protein SCHCODRAFT_02275301 [Schizophyllum commune H4-8]KAI5894381.1 hypothetical protein SCHCODRAFT_02275301 [Schizophyllum commune H4-8]